LETKELNDAATQVQDDRYQPGISDEQILNWCDAPSAHPVRVDDCMTVLPFDSTSSRVTLQDVLLHCIGKNLDRFAYSDLMQVQRCLVHDGWKRLPLSRVKGTARRVKFYERTRAIEGTI